MIPKAQELLDAWAAQKPLVRGIVPLNGEAPEKYGIRFLGYDDEGHEVWENAAGTLRMPKGVREETDREFRERVKKTL